MVNTKDIIFVPHRNGQLKQAVVIEVSDHVIRWQCTDTTKGVAIGKDVHNLFVSYPAEECI